MKRNVAGQTIGAQVINASTGAPFTGPVTVYITKDNGTQTVGSGSPAGDAEHKGNGYHSFDPTQSETNANHIAYTFIGSGAVPVTIQVYTTTSDELFSRLATMLEAAGGSPNEFRFTADALARLQTVIGMQAGNLDAQLATQLAATATRASQASVDDLPTNAELAAVIAAADDAVLAQLALVKAKTDNLPADPADASDIATAFSAVDVSLDTIATVTDKLHTTLESGGGSPNEYRFSADALVNAPAGAGGGGSGPSAADIADAVWDEPLAGHVSAGSAGLALRDTDLRGLRTVIRGTVGVGSSTTSIVTSAFDPAGASTDQFKGRIVLFDKDTATAALRGQGTDITTSSNSGTPTLTVSPLTAAPSSGDTFSVV